MSLYQPPSKHSRTDSTASHSGTGSVQKKSKKSVAAETTSVAPSDEEQQPQLTRKQMQVQIIVDSDNDDDQVELIKAPAKKNTLTSSAGGKTKDRHVIHNLQNGETPEEQMSTYQFNPHIHTGC